MPIVDIELVLGSNGAIAPSLAQSLADTVGRTLKSPNGETWVRLRILAREHYAENVSSVESPELPVFVTVLRRTIPPEDELAAEVSALTDAIANALERASPCVHIEYAPAASGRVSFGGKLVE